MNEFTIWNGFCTVAYFLTGVRLRHEDESLLGDRLYDWYLKLEKK